jgi:hypothetical protein
MHLPYLQYAALFTTSKNSMEYMLGYAMFQNAIHTHNPQKLTTIQDGGSIKCPYCAGIPAAILVYALPE